VIADDELLAPYLAAWREDSLYPSLPHSRELARTAMLAAVASRRGGLLGRALWFSAGFRLRGLRVRMAGFAGAVAVAAAVAAVGWNAPAGSFLHGVRVARQSVQLAVPGADLAGLHLEFAEQSLADARDGIDPAASVADARSELDAARGVLPPDHSSPLWTRWGDDEAILGTEEAAAAGGGVPSAGVPAGGSAPSAAAPHSPSDDATTVPRTAAGAHGSADPTERPGGAPSSSSSPSWGGNDGGDGTPPSGSAPTVSPHDD
jgi:hypothetical protein